MKKLMTFVLVILLGIFGVVWMLTSSDTDMPDYVNINFLAGPASAWRKPLSDEPDNDGEAYIDMFNGVFAVFNANTIFAPNVTRPSRILDLRDQNIIIREADWDYIDLVYEIHVSTVNGYANIILSTNFGKDPLLCGINALPQLATLHGGSQSATIPLRQILPNDASEYLQIEGIIVQVVGSQTRALIHNFALIDRRTPIIESTAPPISANPVYNFLVGQTDPVSILRNDWHNFKLVYDFTATNTVSLGILSRSGYISLTNYLRIMGATQAPGSGINYIIAGQYTGYVNLRTLLTAMRYDSDVFFATGFEIFSNTQVSVDAMHILPVRQDNITLVPARSVPIILYHMILPCENYERNNHQDNCVILRMRYFYKQMRYLYENGFSVITAVQFEDWFFNNALLPPNPVLLHFDDGYLSDYMFAAPILRQFGFTATNFRHTITLETSRNLGLYDFVGIRRSHMTIEQMIRTKDVFEHASHSHNMHRGAAHLDNLLARLGHIELVYHLRNDFVTSLRTAPMTLRHIFAYTYGNNNAAYHEALMSEGVTHAFGIKARVAQRNDNPFEISRCPVHSSGANSHFPISVFSQMARGEH